MYKFSYENNIDRDNLHMTLPLKICHLCWFIHPFEIIVAGNTLSGFSSFFGYYRGSIVVDTENMIFQHCVDIDGNRYFTDLLFESKEETDNYIKANYKNTLR